MNNNWTPVQLHKRSSSTITNTTKANTPPSLMGDRTELKKGSVFLLPMSYKQLNQIHERESNITINLLPPSTCYSQYRVVFEVNLVFLGPLCCCFLFSLTDQSESKVASKRKTRENLVVHEKEKLTSLNQKWKRKQDRLNSADQI